MQIRAFVESDSQQWDDFCANSVNATFLHSRRFLSYHGERFKDLSLIIEDGKQWLAVLPAAEHPSKSQVVVSHPGITYGGLLHQGRLNGADTLQAFGQICRFYAELGYQELFYKAIPLIYPTVPAQDDLYALFRLGAERYRCDLSSSIDLSNRRQASERRRRALRKANQAGIVIDNNINRLAEFWSVLSENLAEKHQATPVHSLAEIQTLIKRFPDNIQLRCAVQAGQVVAGTLLFVTSRVLHSQYIASNAAGQEANALDAVFQHCIETAAPGNRYFDFGISNENDGQVLNEGLYRFKTEFGGGGVVHEFYRLALNSSTAV